MAKESEIEYRTFFVGAPGCTPVALDVPVRLRPLRKRALAALAGTWKFWIKPWDRADYDAWEGLRSPFLAWETAWALERNTHEPVYRSDCSAMPKVIL